MQKTQKCTLKTYNWETSHIGKYKINRKGLWDNASREKSVGKTTSYFQRKTRIWARHGATHDFNPSTTEVVAVRSLNSRSAWSIYWLPEQPEQIGWPCLKITKPNQRKNERKMRTLNHLHFTVNDFTHLAPTRCSLDSCSLTGPSNQVSTVFVLWPYALPQVHGLRFERARRMLEAVRLPSPMR